MPRSWPASARVGQGSPSPVQGRANRKRRKANPEINANSSMPFSRAVPVDQTPRPHASATPSGIQQAGHRPPLRCRGECSVPRSRSEIGPAAQEASAAPMSVAAAMPAMRKSGGNGQRRGREAPQPCHTPRKRTRYHRNTPVSPTPAIMHVRERRTPGRTAGAWAGGRNWSST